MKAEPKPEPQRRRDGRCYVCGDKLTTTSKHAQADAFCSTACCRDYFGTALTPAATVSR